MSEMKKELITFQRIAEALLAHEQQNPVAEKIETSNLYEQLDLSLSDAPMNDDGFEEALSELVLATPKTGTRLFFNQLFGGRQPKAVLGDLLAVMLNNSMYTYKAAGAQIGIEKEIIARVCELTGYGANAGGTFPPGGSMSNFMAMVMARDAYDDVAGSAGVSLKMVSYTSEISHYSVPKNAAFIGLGRNSVRFIPADERGKMIPAELTKQIKADLEKGLCPFFVNATAGTTVLGAFDPISEIAEICKEHQLWLHVDGAYCGGVLFSKQYKHLLESIEKSDSFSFNAHKMLGTPLSCSMIVVKEKAHLVHSFSHDANYLYQTDVDEFNPGKVSMQCGRRNDALKFWTLWKSVGTTGLAKLVEQEFFLADIARNYVRNHPDYTLYSFDSSISICFNYKDVPAQKLCTELYTDNQALVGFGTHDGTEFVRLVTINANNSEADILNFFKVLEESVEKNNVAENQAVTN